MYEHDERLTYAIIGAAIEVHSELGPVYSSISMKMRLCVEFENRGIRFEKQKRMAVNVQGQEILGELYADLIVRTTGHSRVESR